MGIMEILGVDEIKEDWVSLLKALLAETIGTLCLNFFGISSMVSFEIVSVTNVARVSFTFGFMVYVLGQALADVSGAHFNPVITLGTMVLLKTPFIRGLLYMICQCVGAICGSLILKVLTPASLHTALGANTLDRSMPEMKGFGIELLLGFILVYVFLYVSDEKRKPEVGGKGAGPFIVGMTVLAGHLATIELTSTGMNPARSFGASVGTGNWSDHWVFWAGPAVGSLLAALMYKLLSLGEKGESANEQHAA